MATREEEFEQFLELHPSRLVDPMTRIDELLIYLNRAQARAETLLDRQVTAMEAIARAGGITVGGAAIGPITAIPMTPQSLTEIILGMSFQIPGIVLSTGYMNAMTVPGPGVLTFTQTSPPGWVIIYAAMVSFSSDFYSSSLLITNFTVAGVPVLPGLIPLTKSIDIPGATIQPVHENTDIVINFANLTATDAEITLMGIALGLEKAYYDRFYKPLIQKGYATLEEVIALASA